MDLAVCLAMIAAVVNLGVAALHVALARAPGWRIARLFAAIAATAGLYNLLSAVFSIGGLSDAVYFTASRTIYVVATIHGVLWVLYAWSDGSGSLPGLPKPVRTVVAFMVATAAVLAATGWLLEPKVELVDIPWAGLRYHFPVPSTLGDVYGFLATGL